MIRLISIHTVLVLSLMNSSFPGAREQEPGQESNRALQEMAVIEERLESVRNDLEFESDMIESTRSALHSINHRLRSRMTLKEEGRSVLDEASGRMENRLDDLAASQDRDRRQFRRARSHLRKGVAFYYKALHSRPSSSLVRPSLMIWIDRQYQLARVSTDRILRREQELAGLNLEGKQIAEAADQFNIFTRYGVDQLQQRHRDLSGRLALSMDGVVEKKESIHELEERRSGIKTLIEQLEEAETSRRQEISEKEPVDEPPVEPLQMEVVPPESVLNEPGEPEVDDAGPDRVETDGLRQLFWRARPVAVRTPMEGRVVFARPHAGYRHVLIIQHPGSRHTVITNLIRNTVPEGESVSAGDRIGIYQAAYGARAVPLSVEFRLDAEPVAASGWSELAPDWTARLFEPLER